MDSAQTGQAIPPNYHSASAAEVDRAAKLAAQAFTSYSRTSGKERAVFLREIAKRLEAIIDDLVIRVNQEAGLSEVRIRSEAARTIFQMRLFADVIEEGSWVRARLDKGDANRKPPKPDLRSMWRPLGPVIVFGASNFPLAFSVAGGDTASAFAAGNPVIVKAHSAHPGTSELVGAVVLAAARACGMPGGNFFSIIWWRDGRGSSACETSAGARGGIYRIAQRREGADEFGGSTAFADSRICGNGQRKSGFCFTGGTGGARRTDCGRTARLGDVGRGTILHQAGNGFSAERKRRGEL